MPNFTRALRWVLTQEGVKFDAAWNVLDPGYVNDPRDPGGETKFGISKKANPDLNVKELTYDEASAIYRTRYWDANGCDQLEDGMALFIFDSAVQHGPMLVAALRKVSIADGIWARLKYYTKLPTFSVFGRGWTKRLVDLRSTL